MDVSILHLEIENRRKQLQNMKEKYAELKTKLLGKINEVKNKNSLEKEKINESFKSEREILVENHQNEIKRLRKQNKEQIQKNLENIKPNRFIEAQIETAQKDLSDEIINQKSITDSKESDALETIESFNKKATELHKRALEIQQQIDSIKSSFITENKENTRKPTKIKEKLKAFSVTDKENQMSYDFSVQKCEKREENMRQIFENKNSKVRRQIKAKNETINFYTQLIDKVNNEHYQKMNKLKKEVYELTKEPKTPARKPKKSGTKRIREKIEYFDLLNNDLKLELANKTEKLKELKEKNRELTFKVRSKSFSLNA